MYFGSVFKIYGGISINYNQFMAPQMKTIKSGDSCTGVVKVNTFENNGHETIFARIFNESFDNYIKEKDISTISERKFNGFENEHSILMKSLKSGNDN